MTLDAIPVIYLGILQKEKKIETDTIPEENDEAQLEIICISLTLQPAQDLEALQEKLFGLGARSGKCNVVIRAKLLYIKGKTKCLGVTYVGALISSKFGQLLELLILGFPVL